MGVERVFAQPAVSMAIRKLEELGSQLFDR
jgi:DNA-binding transcriptional LysR family regulator